jgi:drug/metabolite transporter (DMT)-like permease
MIPDADNEGPRAKTLMLGAFAIVYVVWGSTYLAIRVAVETMPPFLMAGIRFLVAGGVLFAWLLLRGTPMPSRLHWRNSAIVGVLLLLGGNGLVVWAEQSVPSGLAALLICLSPVWFALFDWARPGGTRPAAMTWLGIAVGFSGVVLLVTGRHGGLAGGDVGLGGLAALMVACASWAAGSVFNRYNAKPDSPLLGAAMQMLCGGAALVAVAALHGELTPTAWAGISRRSVAAFCYLIVFGSWIGFSAYVYLLKVSTPAKVSTYAYVNPVIAVGLGALVLDEPVTARVLWASLVIVAGVVLITLPKRAPAKA